MAFDLDGAADPDETPAELVFQAGVDSFGHGSEVVDQVVEVGHVDEAAAFDFGRPFLFAGAVGAVIGIDHGDVAARSAVLMDVLGVVGCVHDFIEIVDPRSGHGHERDGGVGIVQGRRGQDQGDGDLTAGDVDMGFVSGPAFLEAFAVFLGSDIASGRQVGAHLRQRLARLELRLRARGGAGSSLRGRPRLRGGAAGGGGSSSFAAGFSLASISVASRATTPTMRSSKLRSTSA